MVQITVIASRDYEKIVNNEQTKEDGDSKIMVTWDKWMNNEIVLMTLIRRKTWNIM